MMQQAGESGTSPGYFKKGGFAVLDGTGVEKPTQSQIIKDECTHC
jgi:hypothetical protein